MVVGEEYCVNVREVFDVDCWVCLAGACDTRSEVDVVAGVEEIWLSSC